ncbi:hypothetical protein NDK47_27270 [Brevibacillus ruminantium]|uniref:Uncharacterized protein n=1 Tax=Brevibacillus ruminantium TaxID=2950604 RepID=A0ABY4WFW3_9BACL|nr:hypothetical protein [Brevibacillus ruminantium]USG65754.1 hypothetical protein NDK47_27270 [Brevibacillus ruminantium]
MGFAIVKRRDIQIQRQPKLLVALPIGYLNGSEWRLKRTNQVGRFFQ